MSDATGVWVVGYWNNDFVIQSIHPTRAAAVADLANWNPRDRRVLWFVTWGQDLWAGPPKRFGVPRRTDK